MLVVFGMTRIRLRENSEAQRAQGYFFKLLKN